MSAKNSTAKPNPGEVSRPNKADFEREARRSRPSLAAEFLHFLATSKKWWLLPILLIFFLLQLLAFLSGTGLAPFIYAF